MKRTASISDILQPLAKLPTQAYISNALQVADILEWILSSPHPTTPEARGQIPVPGGAPPITTVYQTTFSISEEFLRRIYHIRQRYNARFIVIIDRKALSKTVQLWKFISRVYDQVWISDNHSKILLIEFPDGAHASMVTSQNLTRGNRAESAVVSSDPQIFYKLLADFNDLREKMSIPMHELMPIGKIPDNNDNNDNNENNENNDNNEKICSEIERLAGYFIPLTDIATVLEINPSDLRDRIADPASPESRAYAKGKAKAKIKLKAQEMELASVGSPLAMQSVRENLVLMEDDE